MLERKESNHNTTEDGLLQLFKLLEKKDGIDARPLGHFFAWAGVSRTAAAVAAEFSLDHTHNDLFSRHVSFDSSFMEG